MRFVGRKEELSVLEDAYATNGFQMVVVWGRRRVGKTALLDEFSRDRHALYFTGQEETNVANLRRFSATAYAHFGSSQSAGPFEGWPDAFDYVADSAARDGGKLLLVFDEFPYAAEADPSLPSALQVAIDHRLRHMNACVVLCGSNEGFMEGRVLGSKSPLYGRRTAQIRLAPFDVFGVSLMLPHLAPTDVMRFYAAFGGTPYYLEQVRAEQTFEQNVERLFFRTSGLLYGEPSMLLRQELREPATYNSVLEAVAHGANRPKAIAERAGVGRSSVNKYLATLVDLRILERRVPFGARRDATRKAIYVIADPFFAFWFRFVGPNIGAVELGAGRAVTRDVCLGVALPTYEGKVFERACAEWVARENREGRLPFLATSFGSWWGTDPTLREQVDVDLVAASPSRKEIIVGESKWRNSFDEMEAIQTLEHRASLVPGSWEMRYLWLFCKRDVSAGTLREESSRDDLRVVTVDEMLCE